MLDEQWPPTYLQVYGNATLEEDFGQAVDVTSQGFRDRCELAPAPPAGVAQLARQRARRADGAAS